MQKREKLGSRLGFILLSAGCAIGVGNVWKFPYMVAQNGGGAFVAVYLVCLLLMGVPVLTMEFSLGRAAQVSPVKLYQTLTPDKKPWRAHGWVSLAGNVLLMMFYTSVSGWILYYFVHTLAGSFQGLDAAGVNRAFNEGLLGSAATTSLYAVFSVLLGCAVCSFGLRSGLERVTKLMMVALLAGFVLLAGYGLTLPGAREGMRFYLKPDFSKITFGTVVSAMNQSFFSLSIGMGSMAVFGSYIGKEKTLLGEAVHVVTLDTLAALLAGVVIIPACFSFHVALDSGPNLLFVTLPNVFGGMRFGRLWGTLFFLFMSFAALSTILAVFENIVACLRDITGWGRKKTCVVLGIALSVLSLPCALGFNALSFVTTLGKNKNIMDLEDFIVTNVILPLGSLTNVLYCAHRFGWGWSRFIAEANTGTGVRFPKRLRWYCACALPALILFLFVYGIVAYFAPGA